MSFEDELEVIRGPLMDCDQNCESCDMMQLKASCCDMKESIKVLCNLVEQLFHLTALRTVPIEKDESNPPGGVYS